MKSKYEMAADESKVGAGIPLGRFRVRPSYLRFLKLRESARIDKSMSWAAFEAKYPKKVAEWDGK